MKKNFIALAVSACAIAIALASCEEAFVYVPGEAEDVSKTYVGALISASRSVEAAGADIDVPFFRNSKEGALEVSLYIEDTTGIFTLVNPTITFADGDSVATAKVSYDYADLEKDVVYNIVVGVSNDDLISEYLPSSFPVAIIKAWQNLGIAQFYDDWWIGGPFEKTLLKSPDGSETYRLVNPWDKASVEDGGLTFVSEIPYFEFSVDEKGVITYNSVLNMGFTFSGYTCHMLHPSVRKSDEEAAKNVMVLENVAQFNWYPCLDYDPIEGFLSWGTYAVAYISFPGGPDLVEFLDL